jgi:hypothetical protein
MTADGRLCNAVALHGKTSKQKPTLSLKEAAAAAAAVTARDS